MSNQKDTSNTDIDTYGHINNVSDNKALISNEIYTFASKKTEKLVTALYMVTDCMDSDDALKIKLRSLSVEFLSDIYKLSNQNPIDKHTQILSSLSRIEEILSFINIASTMGYISEMNTNILVREFKVLIKELESHKSKDKHFTFTLDNKMFELEKYNPVSLEPIISVDESIKDIKRTTFNNLSFKDNKTDLSFSSQSKRHILNATNSVQKEDRNNKIFSIIKDKREVSIKDISISFKDCSEKTIQRELNSLVSKGKIKKIGAKRWSRYQIV